MLIFRLKQLDNHKERIASDLLEMDKPMARSVDDQDRDAHLKAVEREEDPMLQYIRKKKTQKQASSGLPRKLIFSKSIFGGNVGRSRIIAYVHGSTLIILWSKIYSRLVARIAMGRKKSNPFLTKISESQGGIFLQYSPCKMYIGFGS